MQKRGEKVLNITLTSLFVAALVLLIMTFSIGLPIYCRFFYYIQIKTLGMEEATGWSYDTIKTAYDEVLNYLTLPGFEFGTGELKWSESGMSHFADCKVLFNLNLFGFIGAAVVAAVIGVLAKFKKVTLCRPFGFSCAFLAGIIALALPAVLALLVLIVGFDRAFVAFHSIFFPGKDNWIFDPSEDEIIRVMPEEFFMNCAILIGVSWIVISAVMIAVSIIAKRRKVAKISE